MDIVLWNQSSELQDSDGELIAEACDLQMREDVAPAYGLQPPPRVTFFPFNAKLKDLPGNCLVIIFAENESDAGGAAGLQVPDPATRDWDDSGRNFARVYPGTIRNNEGTTLDGELSISAATSHECIEATYDRNLSKWVWNGRDKVLVACEVCDQVEADAYTKVVQGREVAVSNFVYPTWFDVRAPAESQFDQMRKLDAPFTCSDGGYLILYNPEKPGLNVHTEPPEAGMPPDWNGKDKSEGFARTRARLVWIRPDRLVW